MITVKIIIQSLKDVVAGKPILKEATPNNSEECKDLTIGILEAGTVRGRTTLMILLTMADGSVKYAQMTADQLEMITASVRGAVQRFGK